MRGCFILCTLVFAVAANHHEEHRAPAKAVRSHPKFRLTPDGPVPQPMQPHPESVPSTTTTTSTSKTVEIATKAPSTIQEEIDYLKQKYQTIQNDVDQWMESPYHRTVLLPALVGMLSGVAVVTLFCVAKMCCNSCGRRCRRHRISRLSREVAGDRSNLLESQRKKGSQKPADSSDEDF